TDNRALVSGLTNGLRVWDLPGLPPALVSSPEDTAINATWSPDGRLIAERHQFIYDAANNYVPLSAWWPADATSGSGFYATWMPDSQSFLVNHGVMEGQRTRIVEARTGQVLSTLQTPPPADGGYFHDAISPDGRLAASASYPEYRLTVWDPVTGQALWRTEPLGCFAMLPRFSPDNQYVSAGCIFGPVNSPLTIWEARTGRVVKTLESAAGQIWIGAWSPDGRWLAAGGSDTSFIRLYDTQTWELKRSIATPDAVMDLHWLPNGQRLVGMGGGDMSYVIEVADGNIVMQLALPDIKFIGFGDISPDGQFLIAGGGIRRMWQTTDDLIAYAKQGFVLRELTGAEREQFGLPPQP
ncbi:MAG: PD40 domain-containing protein, partial [Anaerolineales bacterium]|nr:PD40 domain-containing protein [Anaerolineales bacterium]